MIAEQLSIGLENAITGKQLAEIFNCDLRVITATIEKERREGQPICASSDRINPGYFLPETAEQLEKYCRRLDHRAAELRKTRRELLKVLRKYADIKTQEGEA